MVITIKFLMMPHGTAIYSTGKLPFQAGPISCNASFLCKKDILSCFFSCDADKRMPDMRRKTPQFKKTEDLSAHTLLQYPIQQQCGICAKLCQAAEAIQKKANPQTVKLIWHLSDFSETTALSLLPPAALASNCICRDFLFHLSRTYLRHCPSLLFAVFPLFRFTALKAVIFEFPVFSEFPYQIQGCGYAQTPTTVTQCRYPFNVAPHSHSRFTGPFPQAFRTKSVP